MNALPTGKVIVRPFGTQQQAIIIVGDKHFVMGAAPIHDTRTLPSQPADLLLAALAADCAFVCREGAVALGLVLDNLSVTAHWAGAEAAEVRLAGPGLHEHQSGALAQYVRDHSPIYRLLAPAIAISLQFSG